MTSFPTVVVMVEEGLVLFVASVDDETASIGLDWFTPKNDATFMAPIQPPVHVEETVWVPAESPVLYQICAKRDVFVATIVLMAAAPSTVALDPVGILLPQANPMISV